jgi:hypothetical protein
LIGGLATAAVAAAAVAVTEDVGAAETWDDGWVVGCSCEVDAGIGAAVVGGVVSWGSDIAKKISCPFLGSGSSCEMAQDKTNRVKFPGKQHKTPDPRALWLEGMIRG